MKILSVVGARPQFIKLAPLNEVIKKSAKHVIVHTGQHYDRNLSEVFFEDFTIPTPDYNLKIGSASPGKQISLMLPELENVFIKEKPDLTIVYGDTNSTLAGAISSVQNHIPVVHVEAGPRYKKMDAPEMVNRLVVDNISSLLFCASKKNLQNLEEEGLGKRAHFVGDLMYDAFCSMQKHFSKRKSLLSRLNLVEGQYHLVTCHRAENTDNKEHMRIIIEALRDSKEQMVFPMHPRTKKMVKKFGLSHLIENSSNITLLEPMGYIDFLTLARYSNKIITDSGGLQREAYFLMKPCIFLFDSSTWPEIEEDGWEEVPGINRAKIVKSIQDFEPVGAPSHLFGKGDAAKKIFEIIKAFDMEKCFDYY